MIKSINRISKGIMLVLTMSLFACVDENGNTITEENTPLGNNITPEENLQPENNTTTIITWEDNSDNEEGFKVERKVENETEFDVIAILANNSTQYSDSINITEKTYCYRVSAFNQAGVSESEEQCEFVPAVI